MIAEYLLIGHGLDGQIKQDDYPQKKLMVVQVEIQAAGSGAGGKPIKTFEVNQFRYKDDYYAVAIGRSTDGSEIVQLIETSGVKPIPKELL